MSRFVFSHHATIDAYLTALGKKLGESVTPETLRHDSAALRRQHPAGHSRGTIRGIR